MLMSPLNIVTSNRGIYHALHPHLISKASYEFLSKQILRKPLPSQYMHFLCSPVISVVVSSNTIKVQIIFLLDLQENPSFLLR